MLQRSLVPRLWCILKESGAIPASTAPRKMNTLSAGLEALADTLRSAEAVVAAFQTLRDTTTEDRWEEICSDELLDALLSACTDLEHHLER
jgi:hypothetical protein